MSSLEIFFLSIPGLDNRVLEGSSVREGKTPWGLDLGDLVHGIKIGGSLVFRLTSRKEHDSWDCWGNSSGQSSDSLEGDFLWGDLASVWVGGTWGDHVWLQEDTLEEDVVVTKGLEDSSIDLLGSLEADVDGVITVTEDFWFNDWDQTIGLADSSVSGKTPGVFLDGNITWASVSRDLEDSSPLGESATDVVEFLSSLGQVIKTEGSSFVVGAWDDSSSLIELNTWDNTLFLQEIDELLAILSGLSGGFFVEDNTGDVFLEIWGGEEEFSVSSSVFLVVFELDVIESLSDSSGGLIGGEDTETSSGDSFSGFLKFSSEVFALHV